MLTFPIPPRWQGECLEPGLALRLADLIVGRQPYFVPFKDHNCWRLDRNWDWWLSIDRTNNTAQIGHARYGEWSDEEFQALATVIFKVL
jgi:hypothetical protein